jgi:DNA-binding transcriptional LysR family regulator
MSERFAGLPPFGMSVHARLVVGSAEAACDAASAGIGIAWAFSYHFQAALERGEGETRWRGMTSSRGTVRLNQIGLPVYGIEAVSPPSTGIACPLT